MRNFMVRSTKRVANKLKQKKIFGILTPISWDANDEVVEFSVYTPHEEDILIINHRDFPELVDHLNKPIYVTGSISHNEDGDKVIKLTKVMYSQYEKYMDYHFHELMRKFYKKLTSVNSYKIAWES